MPKKRVSGHKLVKPSDVLVIKLSEMGSTILALPALRELKTAWPDAKIHFLVFRGSRDIFDTIEKISKGYILEVDESSFCKFLFSSLRALWIAAKIRPGVVLDFDFFTRSTALFSFAVGRGVRVGFMPFYAAGQERGSLLTHRVGYSPVRHTSQSFLALVRSVTHASNGEPFFRGSLEDADLSLCLHQPKEEERKRVRLLLKEKMIPDSARIFLINPNASDLLPLRRWPLERFGKVIQGILEMSPDYRIVLAGGLGDQQCCREIILQLDDPRVVDLSGQTRLGEFLALCERAEMIICNDGGPAHFAGLVGLPSVVLFGPESPDLYRPLSPVARVLYRSLPCSPCVHVFNAKKSACQRAVCLEEISPEDVLAEVRQIPSREARGG